MRELTDKLVQKGYANDDSINAVIECQRLGLQSDARFIETVCNARIRQGYGPCRIKQELLAKQIDGELIGSILSPLQNDWENNARTVWQKKFKNSGDTSFSELQKQRRFLLYRGFSTETIAKLFKTMS